jgi:hypothetical protein
MSDQPIVGRAVSNVVYVEVASEKFVMTVSGWAVVQRRYGTA